MMGKSELKREIGVFGLSANIINTMVGAGIFVMPALVSAALGTSSLLAYLFCGFLIALIMLCFAEVGSKITVAGGAYSYIEIAFGKYPGFLAAFFFLLATITADAAVANAVADIAGSLFPFLQGKLWTILIFLIIFSGLGYINILGVEEGIGFVKMITLAKIIPLVIILLVGLKDISISNFFVDTVPSSGKFGEASLLLFFAFAGAESALSVSGEVRNPQRTIPKSIFISLAVVLILYIFIQLISQAILGSDLTEFTENTLGKVANVAIGPVGLTLLTIGAGVSMFGNLSSEILSMPRVLYAASADRLIPLKILSRIHPKYATPYVSIIVYVCLDFLFASVGGFQSLAILSSASILLIYLGVVIAVIKLRYKNRKHPIPGSFHIPGGLTVPIVAILVILWFLTNLSKNELMGMGLFFVVLTLLYFVINSKFFLKEGGKQN